MKILLSPSKSQDFTKTVPEGFGEKPEFLSETKKLHKILREKSSAQIGILMKVSPKLSDLNYERFQKWNGSFLKNKINKDGEYEFLPALYAFTGDVYSGFTLENYKKGDLKFADKTVRIISGYYGILHPSSFMKPYRLEMSTKLENSEGNNLYKFWGTKLTDHLNEIIKKGEIILNLASVEYSSSLQRDSVKGNWIDVDFKIDKGGVRKIIAIYAKKARGEMANWCVLNRVKSIEDLMKFSENGWKISKKDSNDNKLTFIKKIK